QQAGGSLRIGDLAGNGEYGVHGDGHGQLVAVAVVDDAAPRSDLDGALLLALRALQPVAVAEDLELDQTQADGAAPQEQYAAQHVQALIRGKGRRGGHRSSM